MDATCAQAQALGAKVHKPATDIPNVGRFAVLADPQGATFAVFTPGAGPPPGAAPAQGGFSWHELATTDVAAAVRFYGELFGWTKGPGHDMGGTWASISSLSTPAARWAACATSRAPPRHPRG